MHLGTVCDYVHATMAELSSHDRDQMPKIFTLGPLPSRFAKPGLDRMVVENRLGLSELQPAAYWRQYRGQVYQLLISFLSEKEWKGISKISH